MKSKPIWYLIIGIIFLVVPVTVYLIFLVPELKEEYNVLMASGGILGGFGYYGANKIPDSVKYSGMFKTAARAYTTVILGTIVQDFLPQIIGLIAVLVTSVIIYIIFKELYKNARRKLDNKELATEIARGLNQGTK